MIGGSQTGMIRSAKSPSVDNTVFLTKIAMFAKQPASRRPAKRPSTQHLAQESQSRRLPVLLHC